MIEAIEVATRSGLALFHGDGTGAALAALLDGSAEWEVEIGFGKGRFLLARAAAEPQCRFLGIEVAREYFLLAARRLARHELANLALLRGDALALLGARLPAGFASRLHVYFPDPWPKKRHLKRRLFSPVGIDLVLGALRPGGELHFATDFLSYGGEVRALLSELPGLTVETLSGGWPDGPRTNYEAKYVAEGRPIVRLVARVDALRGPHPAARRALAVGPARSSLGEEPDEGARRAETID